jgi:hypothetical protein
VGKVHLSEIISSVELYCFNIGGGLFSEWEKYTSVKLYLVLSYTVLILEEGYLVSGKSTSQ